MASNPDNVVRFDRIDDLIEYAKWDKNASDSKSYMRDRYPLRFVLFDNFEESREFASRMQEEKNVRIKSIQEWMDAEYPDILITRVCLEKRIKSFVKEELKADEDCVIAPFSEMARFYENKGDNKTFEVLLRTVKGIEASEDAWHYHQRVYIPIVGLDGKMSDILPDTQMTMWKCGGNDNKKQRKVVVSRSTYGVALGEEYSVIKTVSEWLDQWKKGGEERKKIVCVSESIYSNVRYAEPDNAFQYVVCDNAYEFMSKGLGFDFGDIEYETADKGKWEELAEKINTSAFDFEKFIKHKLGVTTIDSHIQFLKLWDENKGEFERWLLKKYYQSKNNGYLAEVIETAKPMRTSELIEAIAKKRDEAGIMIRRECLDFFAKKGNTLNRETDEKIAEQMKTLAEKRGYAEATRYFTTISHSEKQLAIEWTGKGMIKAENVRHSFAGLSEYLGSGVEDRELGKKWKDYICAYRMAKIKGEYTDALREKITEKNADESTFNRWYNDFKTTLTLLKDREDIDVFCWIDGLGIEWIPYVCGLIKAREEVFVNEIMIARSHLPSTTQRNKEDLEKLSGNLRKIGDLDEYAHKSKAGGAEALIEEMKIVEKAIDTILKEYGGKKVAIVSDHGMTYMGQLCEGMGLGGIETDHDGRCGRINIENLTSDKRYKKLDEGNMVCALRHESLGSKTPKGKGAHGGCTPEEVLVPIFILSDKETRTEYNVRIVSAEIDSNNPIVRFAINGEIPMNAKCALRYNGREYGVRSREKELLESERLELKSECKDVSLIIGEDEYMFEIEFTLAVDEDSDFFTF